MTAGRSGEETGSRSGPEADGRSAHGFGNAYGSGNDGENSSGENGHGENGSGDGPAVAGSPAPGARRPGGRTARVREQVLGAVGPLLVEHGFDGLTVDAVAARSGVHRATVYRRWRDVGGLLADVLDAAGDDGWRPADTGSLEGDLRALNEEVQEALTEEPSVALALIAASFRSEEAARALRRFWEERYARCEAVVGRAVERGELSPPVDARRLVVSSTAPLYHQRVLLHSEPDPGLPAEAARTAALAALAGAFSSAPATP